MFRCLLYFALAYDVFIFKNCLNLFLSNIALLDSFVMNLEWLAVRYLRVRGANLFKRSINLS